MGRLLSSSGLVSDTVAPASGSSITVNVSADYTVPSDGRSYIVFADTSSAALTVTLPTGAAGVSVKVIDAGESAGTNIITIAGTIDGAANTTIEANGGSKEISWSGAAWESSGGLSQLFERSAATNRVKTRAPDQLAADQLIGGDTGTLFAGEPSAFSDAESGVDQQAGSWGNNGMFSDHSSSLTYTEGVNWTGTNLGASYDSSRIPAFMTATGAGTEMFISTGEIVIDLGSALQLEKISIGRTNNGNHSFLIMGALRVFGSNDGTTYTELWWGHNHANNYPAAGRSQKKIYDLDTTGAYRYVKLASASDAFYYAVQNKLGSFAIATTQYQSSTNTFQYRAITAGSLTKFDLATLALKDTNGTNIADGNILIEYATDGTGLSWSSQLGINATKALGVVTSGSMWFRIKMVGATRLADFLVSTASTYLQMSNTGFDMIVEGKSVASLDANGGLTSSTGRFGQSGAVLEGSPSNFSNADSNAVEDAGGWGNILQSGSNLLVGSTLTQGGNANIHDGSTSTNWQTTSTSNTIIFDLGSLQDIDAFTIFDKYYTSEVSTRNHFSNVAVSTSADNVTFVEQYNGIGINNTPTNTTLVYPFAGTINTRYVRIIGSGGQNGFGGFLYEVGVMLRIASSTDNSFQRQFTGSGTLTPSSATATDADDSAIQDAEMQIEYSIDGGSFSAAQNITQFRASSDIVYTSSLAFRFTMVGSAKLKQFTISTPNSVLEVTTTGQVRLLDSSNPVAPAFPEGVTFGAHTTAERDAISNPSTGQTIINSTTGKINFFNGSAWQELTSS
jgi:hypothetical protein